MEEVWKTVPGTDDKYQASSHGRLRCYVPCRKYRNEVPYLVTGTKSGGRVSINMGGRIRRLHTLILETFVGPRPEGMVASHLNGNPFNNNLSNLKWETQKENLARRVEHGTMPVGKKHPRCRISEEEIEKIKDLYKKGFKQREIGSLFGVNQGYVSSIVLGRWRKFNE